ncbi:hypothetical protein AJ80_04799 [Polytolypa hystricis UAMH7299]|uniref:Beta-lactamase-related domain-containing protein n=1 Tax=Polytolypa hystricis (strain UAMH7299) TaxID=1447883 RepID=A0A2B7Y8K7_POLH7|nr:hypothetical protein AJ80_04799 [Polytolypa hystricis UAMH7299]
MNKSASFDELCGLGFAKVTLPAQFGKTGFNPSIVESMPVLGAQSDSELVFYHNAAIPGYNHCIMLVPAERIVIVVFTNSISQGDIADWVAQTLQGVFRRLRNGGPDIATFAETLKKERILNTPKPSHKDLIGIYLHPTKALSLEIFEDIDRLSFTKDGKSSQTRHLSHYHNDTYSFLPATAEERLQRALFHYLTHARLIHFKRNDQGDFAGLIWNLDDQAPRGEIFTKF